jgi:hypothetical protein
MVIYRGTDGKPGYHQTDDIHDAVIFVEQLRNDDGVEHARIFRLEEVAFEYRPYFRVELKASEPMLSSGPAPVPAVAPAPAPTPVAAAPAPAPAPSAEPASPTPAPSPAGQPSTSSSILSPPPLTGNPTGSPDSSSEAASPPATENQPAASEPKQAPESSGDNGVGARRGLFGR